MSVEEKIIDSYTTSKLVEPTNVKETEEKQRHWYQFGNERLQLTEEEADFFNTIIAREERQREFGKEIDPSIPWDRATFSWEYRKCRGQNCKCRFGGDFRHGPYLVMVWKDLDSEQRNKVKKKYLGKSKDGDMNVYNVLSDLSSKKNVYRGLVDRDCTVIKLKKCMDIMKAAENGNELAQEYNQKLKDSEVSVDWAYKKVFKLNQTDRQKTKELIQ
jgi:hypothetical protein